MKGREDEECFPPALRYKYDRRGRQTSKRAEPLAADFREAGEGRRLAFLKLVAGMLGVGLDELVQRATTRRHRQLAYVAAASLAGMALTSTLAVTAIQARDAARDQRQQAEGLVAFMVGDLRDKLEPIGRLDALDGVGSRVLAYYKKQDTSELTDDALLQRSRALNLMAEVAYMRGNLPEADDLYRQAMAGTGEAIRRSPDDPQRIFDHAQNVFWLGEIARFQGKADEALAQYSEYKRLGDQLVSMQPDNLKWRMEALYGAEDVGIALYNKRRFTEAARQFSGALGPMQNLVALDPTNQTYQTELPKLFAWLADAERSVGNIPAAIAAREKQIALLNSAVAGGATDVDFRQQLITAHQGLGNLFISYVNSSRGIEEFQAAVAQARQLMPVEPTNKFWKSSAAGAQLDLARALLSLGRRDEAAQQTQGACALVAAIRGRNPATPKLTQCLKMRSRLALQAGTYAQALRFAEQALASARLERPEDPISRHYTVAGSYLLVGDARSKSGDSHGADAAWQSALASMPQGIVEQPPEMNIHALILERLGRATEAQQIASRISAIGYHPSI
jgi:tetratricopeptide (TPR) repeat protein